MKKTALLNQPLSAVVAGMGHRDTLVIADAGLPVPPDVERIDLAVTAGLPPFIEVLAAVLAELEVEEAVIAAELVARSPAMHRLLIAALGGVPVHAIAHEQFKTETGAARAVVRTGEFTPYANVILVAGVVF